LPFTAWAPKVGLAACLIFQKKNGFKKICFREKQGFSGLEKPRGFS